MKRYADKSTEKVSLREMASHGLEHASGGFYTSRQGIDHANPSQWDEVNRPSHYNQGTIEAIDYIKQQLGDDFRSYLLGSVLKYLHRHEYKENPLRDLKKCQWYLERLIKEHEVK